jgi:UDP-3-O-[3-hydroxymyristoyl] glucosamine N-acyltransferase
MPRYNAAEVAEQINGTLEGDADRCIDGLGTIEQATDTQLTFAGDRKNAERWGDSHAKVLVAGTEIELPERSDDVTIIRVGDVDLAMITMLESFSIEASLPDAGVHPSSSVDPSAKIGANVRIGPSCVVHEGCVLGDDTTLVGNVTLHRDVEIGPRTVLHSGAVVHERCRVGGDGLVHANVVIGTDGFGFRPSEDGTHLVKFPHIGTVEIGDHVEIGACTCIDRGKLGATVIGDGTKIDNLCQIGHNCTIGRCCVLCGQVGVAGSTKIGDGTQIGGGAGIADHLTIGRGVSIGARSGVINDIPDGEIWVGAPAGKRNRIMRELAAIRRLPEWSKQLRQYFTQETDGRADEQ